MTYLFHVVLPNLRYLFLFLAATLLIGLTIGLSVVFRELFLPFFASPNTLTRNESKNFFC
ncbi:hypothetical protein [Spirosoma areae]